MSHTICVTVEMLHNLVSMLQSLYQIGPNRCKLDQMSTVFGLSCGVNRFCKKSSHRSSVLHTETDRRIDSDGKAAMLRKNALQFAFQKRIAERFYVTSRMRVIYHNWPATKQRPHPQSVAEISHHSVLSGDRIRQCETSSRSRHKDTDQCL